MPISVPGLGSGVSPLMAFDYDRTIVGFHGTRIKTAKSLVDGKPFDQSTNDDDWLGHGIYFWEYAPKQAWWWAERRYDSDAAVVGALIRLGKSFDHAYPVDPEELQAEAALIQTERPFRRRLRLLLHQTT